MSPRHPVAAVMDGDRTLEKRKWDPSRRAVTERDRHYFTALTGKAAVVTDNAGRRRHEEVWAERDTSVGEGLRWSGKSRVSHFNTQAHTSSYI